MAPIATSDIVDDSGYTPCSANLQLVHNCLGNAKHCNRLSLDSKSLQSEQASKFYCHLLSEDVEAIEQAVSAYRGEWSLTLEKRAG
jgi:hypothetical protein